LEESLKIIEKPVNLNISNSCNLEYFNFYNNLNSLSKDFIKEDRENDNISIDLIYQSYSFISKLKNELIEIYYSSLKREKIGMNHKQVDKILYHNGDNKFNYNYDNLNINNHVTPSQSRYFNKLDGSFSNKTIDKFLNINLNHTDVGNGHINCISAHNLSSRKEKLYIIERTESSINEANSINSIDTKTFPFEINLDKMNINAKESSNTNVVQNIEKSQILKSPRSLADTVILNTIRSFNKEQYLLTKEEKITKNAFESSECNYSEKNLKNNHLNYSSKSKVVDFENDSIKSSDTTRKPEFKTSNVNIKNLYKNFLITKKKKSFNDSSLYSQRKESNEKICNLNNIINYNENLNQTNLKSNLTDDCKNQISFTKYPNMKTRKNSRLNVCQGKRINVTKNSFPKNKRVHYSNNNMVELYDIKFSLENKRNLIINSLGNSETPLFNSKSTTDINKIRKNENKKNEEKDLRKLRTEIITRKFMENKYPIKSLEESIANEIKNDNKLNEEDISELSFNGYFNKIQNKSKDSEEDYLEKKDNPYFQGLNKRFFSHGQIFKNSKVKFSSTILNKINSPEIKIETKNSIKKTKSMQILKYPNNIEKLINIGESRLCKSLKKKDENLNSIFNDTNYKFAQIPITERFIYSQDKDKFQNLKIDELTKINNNLKKTAIEEDMSYKNESNDILNLNFEEPKLFDEYFELFITYDPSHNSKVPKEIKETGIKNEN